MKHRLSASGIARARKCQFWVRGDAVWPEREPSREAAFGTAIHEAIAKTIESGERVEPDADAVDDLDADRLQRTFDRWAEWWPTARGELRWQAEKPVAWNVRTGEARWLPKAEHRDYGTLDDYEIPGTIDALANDGERVYIIDWKSGRQSVEAPDTNPQLGHNGAAAAAALRLDEAEVAYIKIGEDAIYRPEPATVDAITSTLLRDELRSIIDRAPTSKPEPGPWCQFCPMRGACPATESHVAEVIDAAAIVRRHPVSLDIRNNDQAAFTLTAIDGVEAFLSELKKRVREYADKHGGILLADGTVWSKSEVRTERPDLSVDGALQALYALGLIEAIESKTTWAAIKRAGGKDGEKAAREKLKAIGAVKASTAPRYEAREVKTRKAG